MIFNWFKADLLNGKGKIESAFCALQMSGTDATLFPSEGNTAVFKQDEGPGTQVQVHEFDVGETWLAIPPRFAPAIRNDGPPGILHLVSMYARAFRDQGNGTDMSPLRVHHNSSRAAHPLLS